MSDSSIRSELEPDHRHEVDGNPEEVGADCGVEEVQRAVRDLLAMTAVPASRDALQPGAEECCSEERPHGMRLVGGDLAGEAWAPVGRGEGGPDDGPEQGAEGAGPRALPGVR